MRTGLQVGRRERLLRLVAAVAALTTMVVVIWLDIRTGVWQEVVILSGIAAGLVTFLLTALFLDRILARSEHERWRPVTRLALVDVLHTLAHEDSDLSRGRLHPRRLELPDGLVVSGVSTGAAAADGSVVSATEVERLLGQVVQERQELTEVLARWSAFLAASADVPDLMGRLADIAWHLDAIRDAGLEVERGEDPTSGATLARSVARYNAEVEGATVELLSLLAQIDLADDRAAVVRAA